MSQDDHLIDIALGKKTQPRVSVKKTPSASSSPSTPQAAVRQRWGLALLLLAILYLLLEMIFNASLVQVAGSGHASEDELTRIELLGRSLSGIGVSLLLAGWALKGPALSSRPRRWTVVGLIFVVTWPLVFFGQRAVIDQYLIEPSSAEQRQRAYYAQVIRQGLASNSIEIEGVPHNPNESYSGESLTFIALFGALLYADTGLINKVEMHTQAVVKKMVTDVAYQDFPAHYERYQAFRQDLQNEYRRYAQASNNLNAKKSTASQEADKAWNQVEQQISQGWQEYQQGLVKFDREVNSKAEKLTPQLKTYFDRIAQCSSNSCRKTYNDHYAKQITQLGVGYIEPSYWLLEEKVSTGEKVATSLLAGVLTGGISLAVQGLNLATGGNGGMEKSRFYFLNDAQDIAKRLSVKLEPQFSAKAKGYTYNLSSYEMFRSDAITARQVIQSSRKKGINLPDSWTLNDRVTFNHRVDQYVEKTANATWKKQSQNQGFNLPPNLSWERFQLHPEVQTRIRDEMGESLYVKPMRADWNNKQFLQRVIEPNIDKKVKDVIRQLKHELVEYENGGRMEDASKSALRAILVPPISMGLSLLLIVLTLCNLPMRMWKLGALFVNASPANKTGQQRRFSVPSLIVAVLPPILVLVVPLVFFSSSYLSTPNNKDPSQPPVIHYFMDQVSQQASPLASLGLRWVMAAQPQFQPLGSALNESTQLLEHFSPVSDRLHRLDNHFFSIQYYDL